MRRGARVPAAWLLVGVGACQLNPCVTPPPTPPSPCWTHDGGADGRACAGASEHQPNDNVSEANGLPAATCATQTFTGQLADDVDVFRTTGPPCSGSAPTATLRTTTDPNLRLCVFVACRKGKTGMQGCALPGSSPDASLLAEAMHLPEGMLGCCSDGPGGVGVPTFNCDAEYATVEPSRPDLDAYIVVDRSSGDGCAAYTIDYHF